jgi:hypothetical protein
LVFGLGLTAGGHARAQFGAQTFSGGPTAGTFGRGLNAGAGYGSLGGYGAVPSYGYSVGTGQVGSGYRSASGLYLNSYQAARPQTTIALQPLYNAITSVPGWYGPPHRVRHRSRARAQAQAQPQPSIPLTRLFDDDGKILWPSTIPSGPETAELRQAAEAAVRTVVRESKLTGHASIRPVIDAKNKLTAFEQKALPEVKAKNATDAAALQTFFHNLDRALDAMTYVY